MNKTQLFLIAITFFTLSQIQAQVIFSESFNGGKALNDWTLFDVDGRTPDSNVNYINDAWVIIEDLDNIDVGDSIAVSTSWYSPAGQADDYILTPSIILTESNVLFYSAQAFDGDFPDGYEVRISNTTPTVAGLLANPALFTTTGENPLWTRRSFSLRQYAGDTVYIGWRNNSDDQFMLAIDNISVEQIYTNDAEISNLTINRIQAKDSAVTITGAIRNAGLSTLTAVTVNWSSDGGTTVNSSVLTVNLANNKSSNFSHPITLTASNPGKFSNVSVWTSLPNSVPDSNTISDTLNARFFVNNGTSVQKNPLLEEFTTAPCQFCPDGAVEVERVLAEIPNAIGVGLHACFSADSMTIPEAITYCLAFSTSAPTATIDRVLFPEERRVGHNRSFWLKNAQAQASLVSPMQIDIKGTYDTTTRIVDVTINSTVVDIGIDSGDLRVTLFVVEDHVRGVGRGYDQKNFYNTQTGHPYAGAGNPILNYDHRHVLRDVYPTDDAWGESDVIPTNPVLNKTYSTQHTVQLDNSWNEDSVSLIGFVSYYDSIATKREVINAFQVKLNMLVTGIKKVITYKNTLRVYPNPTEGLTKIEFNLSTPQNVSLNLRDITGKLVLTQEFGKLIIGKQVVDLDVSPFTNGIYFATITIGNELISKKISVNK